MKIYQVIIVDDHPIFLRGLSVLLNEVGNVKVVGEAANGKKFLEIIEGIKPDIVFMDIKMSIMNGIEATKKCIERYPETKIIALTMFGESHYVNDMIQAGALGFLNKDVTIEKLQEAISTVLNGRTYFSDMHYRETSSTIKHEQEEDFDKDTNKLTEREIEVLKLISEGLSTVEIAQKLYISHRTVERHRSNLLAKTNKKNTAALVRFAIANDYI